MKNTYEKWFDSIKMSNRRNLARHALRDQWEVHWMDVYSWEAFQRICDDETWTWVNSEFNRVSDAIRKYWSGERDDALFDLDGVLDYMTGECVMFNIMLHDRLVLLVRGIAELREQIADRSF